MIPDKLDTVEKTIIKLLQEGCSVSEISRLLGLDVTPVISGLVYKGILYSDNTFRGKLDL